MRIRHVRCAQQSAIAAASFLLPRLGSVVAAAIYFTPTGLWCRGNCRAANIGAANVRPYNAEGVLPRQIVAKNTGTESTLSRPGSVIAAAILPRQGFGAAAVSAIYVPRQLSGG